MHRQGLGLKQGVLDGWSAVAKCYQNLQPDTDALFYHFLDVLSLIALYCKDSLSTSHYGKYNLQHNLLCFTKKCLFKIPWSIIKRAIELQNTVIIARLGGALAH